MKKPQKKFFTFLLFILGAYGEQLLSFLNALIEKSPSILILIIALILVTITE